MIVSVPPHEASTVSREIAELLNDRLREGRLESLSKNEDSTVISYAFRASPQGVLLALQAELDKKCEGSTTTIFFNRSATM